MNAVRDGNIQKTTNITPSGDHRNYVTLEYQENVTAHNLPKEQVLQMKIQIYGGDTFYLSADLLLTGKVMLPGNLYGSVGKTWRTLAVLTTGDSKQDIGVFESETAALVSFSVQWLNMTRIELMKERCYTQNPLSGEVVLILIRSVKIC